MLATYQCMHSSSAVEKQFHANYVDFSFSEAHFSLGQYWRRFVFAFVHTWAAPEGILTNKGWVWRITVFGKYETDIDRKWAEASKEII